MSSSMVDETALADYRAALRGQLVTPDDENCDAALAVYNAMIDRRPAFIAYFTDAADVMNSVNFARDHELRPAEIKSMHDPENLFNVNQNIKPGG